MGMNRTDDVFRKKNSRKRKKSGFRTDLYRQFNFLHLELYEYARKIMDADCDFFLNIQDPSVTASD